MKLFNFSLILCLFTSAIYAQSNYHQGYVLKNNGDTIKGYINYHEWTRSPRIIDFKIEKTDNKAIKFHPGDVKGFGINGMETFISYTGYISTNKTIFPDYPQQIDTGKVLDTIFLQQIETGKNLTLYYNSDNIKTRFFIAKADSIPEELKYYVYYNNFNQVVTAPVYIGQLTLYINKFAADNSKMLYNLKNMDYDQLHLKAFLNDINNVNNNNRNTSKNKLSRFFVGVAINRTNTQFSNFEGTGKLLTTSSTSPKINFGVDIFNNPNIQQLIFRTEVSLSYIMPRFNIPVTIDDAQTAEVYEFNQYSAAITPQVLLNVYNTDSFKFYIDGGWAFNFSAYSNNQETIKNEDVATTVAYTFKKPYILESFWSSFPIQAGVVLNKKIEIYASFNFYSAYTKYDELSISNQSASLGVKYLMK